MTEYRICKNNYGYYKIQYWRPPERFLFFFTLFGCWEDRSFRFDLEDGIWDNRDCAEKKIGRLIEADHRYKLRKIENEKKSNDTWVCDEEKM